MSTAPLTADPDRLREMIRVLKDNWREEMVVARVYRSLAQKENDEQRRNLLALMAVSEEEHAELWARRLADLGVAVDAREANEPFREQNRQLETVGVREMIRRIEREERQHVTEYQAQIRALNDPASTAILEKVIPDERLHAERLYAMVTEATGIAPRGLLRPLGDLIGLGALRGLSTELKVALVSGLALAAGAVGSLAGGTAAAYLSPALYFVAIVVASIPAVKGAAEAVRARKVDVEILMLAAAYGAALIGNPGEGALLLFLFALSGALEHFALGKTRDAIRRLVAMRPQQVRLEDDRLVPVETVPAGARFVVHPGEAFPLDGRVVDGRSSVDQSAMTGESQPVSRGPGDRVVSGTLNLDGILLVEAISASSDSALERVIKLVREAQGEKSLASAERLANRVGLYYTPIVLVGAVAWFFWSWLGHALAPYDACYRALALLIGASPCALVLSTPAAVLSALAGAGRRGLLVRSGSVLEALARVTAVVFDKTGTLTRGLPEVGMVWASDERPEEMLGLAAAAERASAHPLARAVVRYAQQREIDIPESTAHRTVPGEGVEAVVGGIRVRAGRSEWIDDPRLAPIVEMARQDGQSLVAVAAGDEVGLIALQDAPRMDAFGALEALRRLGVKRLAVVTGDHRRAAEALANRLGLTDVRADLRPEQKADAVHDLTADGEVVAMVGDGVNDAPALARSAVGIALGGIGSDVALDSADVVVMEDRLPAVAEALALARRARQVATQNVVLSLLSVLVLSATVIGHGIPLPLAVVGHEGTTVLVVLNGLRLLRF